MIFYYTTKINFTQTKDAVFLTDYVKIL